MRKAKDEVTRNWAAYLAGIIYRIAEQLELLGYRVNVVIDPEGEK